MSLRQGQLHGLSQLWSLPRHFLLLLFEVLFSLSVLQVLGLLCLRPLRAQKGATEQASLSARDWTECVTSKVLGDDPLDLYLKLRLKHCWTHKVLQVSNEAFPL